jgi:hypothetical protein
MEDNTSAPLLRHICDAFATVKGVINRKVCASGAGEEASGYRKKTFQPGHGLEG